MNKIDVMDWSFGHDSASAVNPVYHRRDVMSDSCREAN